MVIDITAKEFKEKIFDYDNEKEWKFKGTKPTLVEYGASWCNPCKMLAPVLDEISNEHPEINFYKVDTEVESELSLQFAIRSIPAVLYIPLDGQPKMVTGFGGKESIEELLKKHLHI